MRKTTLLVLALAGLTACSLLRKTKDTRKTVVRIVRDDDRFTQLTEALKATGLDEHLSEAGPYTLFAPTDAAFAQLTDVTLADLMAQHDKSELNKILAYHVVSGRWTANYIKTRRGLTTLLGPRITVSVREGRAYVDGVRVAQTDVIGRNGIVHVINAVLMPK